MAELLIDAGAFDDFGGWTLDQQSVTASNTAYLLASGCGTPVADAVTEIDVPEAGLWRVFVRTRNWTAVWKRGTPGGVFQIRLRHLSLAARLGTESEKWSWQCAGAIDLPAGKNSLELHDLTGFCGRCQTVYLTTDPEAVPPDGAEEFHAFRARLLGAETADDPETYDLVVAGGGYAGICTAVAAAKSGAKVLLVHDRGVFGGCNSSEIRVALGGGCRQKPYENLGRIVDLISPVSGGPKTFPAEYYEDFRKRAVFANLPESRCRTVLWERVTGVEMAAPDRIAAVVTRNVRTGKFTRRKAVLFADCTGDGAIARASGASYLYGRDSRDAFHESLAPAEPERMVMGHSVLWYAESEAHPSAFPDLDWGLEINGENVNYKDSCAWEWETGQFRDQVSEIEYVRDYGIMTLLCNWSYLKNHAARKQEYACKRLVWASPLGGKREGIRVIGDLVLTQNDLEKQTAYPDATALATWNIDLHMPDPKNAALFAEPFCSCAYHRGVKRAYPVPFRCLYSKDVANLFLGGRLISLSHVAFAFVRVMRTLGMLGEVAGMAAALCRKFDILPRELGRDHFPELAEAMRAGVPWQRPHDYACGPSESYHFHDFGFFRVAELDRIRRENPEIAARIDKLGVTHKADE